MDWLLPSVVAALTGTVVLVSIYAYLYRTYRTLFLGIWTLGWAVYVIRFVFELLLIFHNTPLLNIAHEFTTLLSSMLLLCWGVLYCFVSGSMSV